MNIAFVCPNRQVDAIHEPPRGGVQIGPILMASLLKEKGHEVHYMDESVRAGGWHRRSLSIRTLRAGSRGIQEKAHDRTWEEVQAEKMADFRSMSPADFLKKWSAFKDDCFVERIIARIGVPEKETIERLRILGVEAVGIPLAASANYLAATSLGRRIKLELPHVRVVMGGQHITADPEGFVRENPWVDHVAAGDAITTIEDMMAGRLTSKIVKGGFQTMAEYPIMNCDLFADAGYSTPPTHNYPSGLKSVDWMASRGCYRDCAFCFAGRKEQTVTQSSWDKIRAQLDHFVASGIQELVLQDDAVLFRAKTFFLPLLKEMKSRGLSWSDNGGVEFESFSNEIAEAIIAYNDGGPGKCISLYVPFNPRSWNENINSAGSMTARYENSLENLRRVRKADVYVLTSLIVGTPDQTHAMFTEDVAASRKLIVDGYLDSALPLSATMLPGTEWFTRNGHNIVHPDDWTGYNLFSTHHSTDHMTPREIEECMIRCVQELADVQKIGAWQCAFA